MFNPLSWTWVNVRIRSTILTQPGTPVSFQGMFIHSLFDFWKLRIFQCFPFPENSGTPTFPISGNSGLRHFPIFLYYIITLFSCLHLSLVTLSAVVTFGSDRIRTYRGKDERPSPADSYQLSSPECVLEKRDRDQRRLRRPEPNQSFWAFRRNLRERRGETSNISSKVCSYEYRRYIY